MTWQPDARPETGSTVGHMELDIKYTRQTYAASFDFGGYCHTKEGLWHLGQGKDLSIQKPIQLPSNPENRKPFTQRDSHAINQKLQAFGRFRLAGAISHEGREGPSHWRCFLGGSQPLVAFSWLKAPHLEIQVAQNLLPVAQNSFDKKHIL